MFVCLSVRVCSQLAKKHKQVEEDKKASAPTAVCDEASSSDFTDIPLSLPYHEPEEQQQSPAETPQTTTQASDPPSQDEQAASKTLSTSVVSEALQSNLNVSAESKKEEKDDFRVEAQMSQLKVVPPATELGKDAQAWVHPCVSAQFEILNVPSAPALYPSVPTLEEGPVIQLCEEAAKSCVKEPAVLALPEILVVGCFTRRAFLSLQSFSLEQLSVWEPAGGLRSFLEGVEVCATQFCALARQENHELTELLQNYWRCRRQLTQSHTQLHTQTSDCKSTQNRLWSFRDEQLTLQGLCADQSKVCGYHRFQQAEFNQSVLAELRRMLEACSELLHQKVVLHAYTALLSRLQVESYLYRLLKGRLSLHYCSGSQTEHLSLQPLKEAISVLFSFTRRVLDDAQFQTDIHHWLESLVAVLLHVGGSGEHLYLLCHLLCCPAGVGKWAASFLQVSYSFLLISVVHFMQALAVLMSPARHRAEFLGHMKPCETQSSTGSGPDSGNWTLVDEGGEEDEDPDSSWLLLCEEDLILLLSQFSFQQLYSHMLGMSVYEPQACSSQKMMRVFAFASSLIEILALGLQTYNRARYRQLVKRIGHIIRMTVCYVSDHWAQYVSVTDDGGSSSHVHSLSLDKLQLEYDHLFLRAVLHVLRNKRLGIWLFMSEMPYGTLSSFMLWKVLYVMQCAETAGVDTLSSTRDTHSCIQALRDPKHHERFEQWLCEVNSSDGISLLTALAHMATPTQHSDPTFITTITMLIYQVSYVSVSTREIYSKVGRELLAAIAAAHPYVISVILERLRETIQTVGMVALYLCKELPLSLWQPRPEEICVIGSWLLQHPLSAVENRLACVILEGLNWGYTQGSLALPSFLHSEVALLVAEAYQKYLTDKPYSGLISEGIKQVSYLASVLRLGVSPEASFSQWAWQLLLRLKLHGNAQNPKGAWLVPASASNPPPELTHSPSMHSVLRAVKAGIPIGCYLSIAMTTVGHSLEHFCTDGVGLLKSLIQSRYLRAAVHLLDNILPPTYPLSFYLLNNSQFVSCIQLFLQYDSVCPQGVTQQVTHRVAPLLTGTTYGENVRLLNSVIQSHVVESSQPGRVGTAAVLEFWVGILTQQNLWYRDKTVLFLMDQICCAAFKHHQEECVQKLLYQQHKNALGYHGDRGLLSSLVGWIAGNVTPSFIEGQSLSEEVWFAWLVLSMEGVFEEDSQLRRCVEHELLSEPSMSPDQALKKAQQRLKLPVAPSLQRLQVYRWACQAVATPPDHLLLPLIWQKFLQLYLRQPGPELAAAGCIGRRFFQTSSQAALLRDLKLRIQEVSDFHYAASQALRVPPPQTPSSDSQGDESPSNTQTSYLTSPQLHTELVRLFGVFAIWLDDETLQKQEVYLPSLPPEYEPHRLAQVMQRQQELWLEYVDQERLQYDEKEVLSLWEKVQSEPVFLQTQHPGFTDYTSLSNAKERILSNLQKHPVPRSAPELQQLKAPVAEVPASCLSDSKAAAELLQQDLSILQEQARIAVAREAQQVALEQELLESLPLLFKNQPEQISMPLVCKGKGGQPCQGAANITFTCESVQKQEAVQTQIASLRRDIKKLQTDAMAPPPQSLAQAAVHTENFITSVALVNMHKAEKSLAVQQVGVSAFYQVVSFVCEDTLRHPPTRQYLSSCVEILGQVFIQGNAEECGRVLEAILEQRHLCPLISPFFTPNAAPNQLVFLYQDVVTSLHLDSADVVFMLLTKFDLPQWLNEAHPVFSERTRLLELVHGALCVCGRDPEPELLTPFHLFTKHWTWLLRHHFPDHYSDCVRLLMNSSSDQLLSPECWKVTLRVLGCLPPSRSSKNKSEQSPSGAEVPSRAVGPQTSTYRPSISLSPQQVDETVDWLSDFFMKSRLSKADLRSFGLYSTWTPYVSDVVSFWDHLISYLCLACCTEGRKRKGTNKVTPQMKPSCLCCSSVKCYPWLETDAAAAGCLVGLYTQLIDTLHHKFRDRLLPGQRGALWLCMAQYCESCTSPRTPEYLLYLYHTHLRSLPWRYLHPDTQLMEQLFSVERGSPKNCFLFMGEVLCEVNWVSVLSDHFKTPSGAKESHSMLVYLLYMLVCLAKEEQLLTQQESPLLSLLVQSTSLPWHQLDLSSYQSILGYVSTHYPPSLLLNSESALAILIVYSFLSHLPFIHSFLFSPCQSFSVQSLVTLEQGGGITLSGLEAQLETLLESIITFNPQRHMAFCSLFSDALALLNGVGVSTGEALAAHVITWLDRKGRGFPILPLLTACSRCLASVRHMTRIMEACITAYFNHAEEEAVGWGPVLASLQVPELTVEDFLSESQSAGSFLTLYAFILQRLNTEYTAANERRTLALINTGPGDEAKLFLWWHKALNLSAEQLQPQAGQTEVSGVILGLIRLHTRLLQLGEERLNSGLLGAIGLGKRSPVSNRFRVVVRSLAAFLCIQVSSETELRLQPTSDLQLSAKAQQTLGMLEAMPSNKQYAELEDAVNKAVQFIRYPGHCLRDGPRLLALLANLLYPELRYLHIIR
uniref:Ectopic P-granules autophagy protein 5 homolog (C. elegans) n=1 Tax=Salarias fasciatus TaxID=181472 RepID=A0A672I9K1_SALFA